MIQPSPEKAKPQGKKPSHRVSDQAIGQEVTPQGKRPSQMARSQATEQEAEPQGKKPSYRARPGKRPSHTARDQASDEATGQEATLQSRRVGTESSLDRRVKVNNILRCRAEYHAIMPKSKKPECRVQNQRHSNRARPNR